MSGVNRIAFERARQINEEGWTPEHDQQHSGGELAIAAVCYLQGTNFRSYDNWPWDEASFKPGRNRIRQLEKAGALVAAEIDRLERNQDGN